MATRGKSMWKILFNFINVNSSELNEETFSLVEDILCKDPSLISFQTGRELEYSDLLLCWIINKLLGNLVKSSLHRSSNLQLQKGLLFSCIINRPALLSHITLCYADVINQIAESMEHLQESYLNDDQEVTHILFGCRKTLNELDAQELKFTSIGINLREAETLMEVLLQILMEAFSIGFEIYPNIFAACLPPILKALKKCGLPNKILCLKYFCAYFESVKCIGLIEEYLIFEVLSSVSSMWEIVPLWLTLDLLCENMMSSLAVITADIITSIQNLVTEQALPMQLLRSTSLFENVFCTLLSIIEATKTCGNSKDILTLLQAYTELIFCFQIKFGEMLSFELEKCEILQTKALDYPIILRLLACTLVQKSIDVNLRASNTKYFQEQFLNIVKERKNVLKEPTKLYEILLCFLFLQNNCQSTEQVGITLASQLNANLLSHIVREMLTMDNVISNSHDVFILIAFFFLKIDFLRGNLASEDIQKLLEFIKNPVECYVQSILKKENKSRVNQTSLYVSIISLCKLNDSEMGAYVENIQCSIRNFLGILLTKKYDSNVESIDNTKLLFCQQLPHLVVRKICSDELAYSILSQNINMNLFPFLSKNIGFGQSKQPSTRTLKFYVPEACNHNESDFYQCCKTKCGSTEMSIDVSNFPKNLKTFIYRSALENKSSSYLARHVEKNNILPKELLNMLDSLVSAQYLNTKCLRLLISKCRVSDKNYLSDMVRVLLNLLSNVLRFEQPYLKRKQLNLLQILKCGFDVCEVEDDWIYFFFKMSIILVLHPHSYIAHDAVTIVNEMCRIQNLYPMQLWNWHKKESLDLVIKLAICTYVQRGVRCTQFFKYFTKILGFTFVQELVCKHYRLMLTLLVPYCIEEHATRGLIVGISETTQKTVQGLLRNSFFRIYTHVHTNNIAVGKKCVDMVIAATSLSLNELLNANIKQTVFELLVHFHRNPEFVKKTFLNVYSMELGVLENSLSRRFSSFIADRFLGIITYFESCLGDRNIEKPIKEAALCSLSELIRFVGPDYVTKYRFKIIAMLEFVKSLNDSGLNTICLKIWNIFLHVVNTHQIGPSLSYIAAALQQYLFTNETEVNNIYKFLILEKGDLFDSYLPELYFLDNVKAVVPSVRTYITEHVNKAFKNKSDILESLLFFCNQISSSNIQIRIHGLKRLQEFISNHREDLNQLILNVILVDTVLEKMTDALVSCCRHEDFKLQLAASKCIGELGAVDPSYLTSTYSYEQSSQITLGVHTDQFTVMALQELCRAYQSHKGTKHVDKFSIAIQETLSASGILPNENKKLEIWESMPFSMRQIMTPFLTSCYTVSGHGTKCRAHPIYNSSTCRKFTDWAFTWATRLIDNIKTADTKHLLNSYKPSIRCDDGILALFFPYILIHSLEDCTDNEMQAAFEEFDVVLMSCQQAFVPQQTCVSSILKEFNSSKYGHNSERPDINSKIDIASVENVVNKCSKLCSEMIDFLRRWIYEWERTNNTTNVDQNAKGTEGIFKRATKFLAKFDKLIIAKSNFNTHEFARSLIYLEEYILEDLDNRLQSQITFLMQIHCQLDDVDSVEGCINVKTSNLNLSEEILFNLMTDRPHEAMNCYEHLMSFDLDQVSQENIKGMINCYLSMETPETALLVADGLWQKFSEQYTDEYFKENKLELYWRLGRYKELKDLLEDNLIRCNETNWSAQCAQAFLLFRQPITSSVEENLSLWIDELDKIRGKVLQTMRSSFYSKRLLSYPYSYNGIIKLHLITEVEKAKLLILKLCEYSNVELSVVSTESCVSEIKKFLTEWKLRLNIVQPMVRVIGPILNFRRNILLEAKQFTDTMMFKSDDLLTDIKSLISIEIGKLWMKSAQIYRDGGHLQQAHISLMKAEQYAPKVLFIEKAKLFWKMGNHRVAFKIIEENLKRLDIKCDCNLRCLPDDERILYAEAKFLLAKYNAESMSICADLNLRYFKDAISLNKNSEKCQVNLAHYMEKIYNSYTEKQKYGENGRKIMLEIMLSYAKSLRCGFENIYQSLPRLLTLWLDYTTEHNASSNEARSSVSSRNPTETLISEELARKMNDLIINCSNMLSTSIFYTAFSQMLSRICHPSDDVFNILRTIIIKLAKQYPHQSLWKLLPVFKSFNTHRTKRCKLILSDSRLGDHAFQKLLLDFNSLSERLIELTNKEVAPGNTYDLSVLVKQLPKLFDDQNFTRILLPFEKFLQISFPVAPSFCYDIFSESSSMLQPANPFPHKQVFICGVNKEIIVLRSAAKPKKITLRCNDGHEYAVMVKPKDDLRRDFRLMEFNDLVKRYLHLDYIARNRRLRIRTYSVVPFNEECGLLEWLPKLNSFRSICTTIYRKRNLGMTDRELRQHAVPKIDPIEAKRRVFLEQLLPKHPPVFHEWFLQQFPTPFIWYKARTSYVKTIAVMSIVGYILGLGDRHGENILFDETNGDAVHVDFNCLFNQGEYFAFPELVPFRLTHNMTFAMGPLKVEGLFRKTCEITLRILKHASTTLMSVLRPFVYDLVVYNRNSNKQQCGMELTDPKAMMDVRRIDERLQGFIKKTSITSMPLSIEGQVNLLIDEAVNLDNLASMYIGWGAYL